VGVDLFGEVTDALGEFGGEAGVVAREGKGFEAARLVVHRPIFQRTACCQRPLDMDLA
jgi:hypothetical protein